MLRAEQEAELHAGRGVEEVGGVDQRAGDRGRVADQPHPLAPQRREAPGGEGVQAGEDRPRPAPARRAAAAISGR